MSKLPIDLIKKLNQYDQDGFLRSKTEIDQVTNQPKTTSYSYGALGELQSVVLPDNTAIRYYYNANNQRVAKEVNGSIVQRYLWLNQTTLLAVYDGNGALKYRFEYAGERTPVAYTNADNQIFYLSYNHLGSLKAVRNSSGVIKQIDYDSFGNVINDTNPDLNVPIGFAGGLYDRDTKLVRFGYRDYDPFTGRWTAKDPIDFSGGSSNLYGYVGNDPINYVDPEGLAVWFAVPIYKVIEGVVVAIIGTIALNEWQENVAPTMIDAVNGLNGAPGEVFPGCEEAAGSNIYPAEHRTGERNLAAKPSGTDNEFKHMKPDPTNPDRVLSKDANGQTKPHPKPPGFDEYWNNKHQKK